MSRVLFVGPYLSWQFVEEERNYPKNKAKTHWKLPDLAIWQSLKATFQGSPTAC